MDHNMVLSYNYAPSENGSGDERMHIQRWPFRWPCRGVEVIHAASPNAACPGLHWKPLDAAIGQLLAPYPLGGRQGDSKQNNDVICTHLMAILMAIVMRRYYTAWISQWRRSRAFIWATKHCHQVSTRSDSINRTHQCRLFLGFHREKGIEFTCWPLITIGVWHIRLMRSAWLIC